MAKAQTKKQEVQQPTQEAAKLKPVSEDHVPSEEEFDLLCQEYLQRQKEAQESLNYLAKQVAPQIQAYIRKHGEHTKKDKPEDAILIRNGYKWHNQGAARRVGTDQIAVDYCVENGVKATKKVTVLDKAKWKSLCDTKEIPTRIVNKVNEVKVSYKLCYYDVSDSLCPQCEAQIGKKDKFCKSCGCKLKDQ